MLRDEVGSLLWGGCFWSRCFIDVAILLLGAGGKGEDCET